MNKQILIIDVETTGLDPSVHACVELAAILLDADLADQPCLFAHPLVNDMTLGVSGADLMRFFTHTGHDPRLLVF